MILLCCALSYKIILCENEKLIINDQKCAEVFNNYFNSVVKYLNIPIDQNLLNVASVLDDPIITAVYKYKKHPSFLKIKEKVNKKMTFFLFIMLTPDKMLKIVQNIDCKNSTQQGEIPVRIIKESKFTKISSEVFNFYIHNNNFPNGLKKADIKLVYKKDDLFHKTNCRAISILPVLSKAFEHCLYDHYHWYYIIKVQCGFRKGFSMQYSLIAMIEKWKKKYG